MIRKYVSLCAVLIGSVSIGHASVENPWEGSLGFGTSIAARDTFGYAHQQDVLWATFGYHTTPWFSLGMEGGQLFGKDIDFSDSFSVNTVHVSSIYIGPYIQAEKALQNFTFYGRLGFGSATSSTHVTVEDSFGKNHLDTHETNMGMTFTIGARLWLWKNFGLGAGFRDMMLLTHEQEFDNAAFNVNDTLHGSHFSMPFGELVARF